MNRRAFFRRTVGGVVAATVAPMLPPACELPSVPLLLQHDKTQVLGGWGQPTTWMVGELVTASLMNEHVRDNLLFLRDEACERS